MDNINHCFSEQELAKTWIYRTGQYDIYACNKGSPISNVDGVFSIAWKPCKSGLIHKNNPHPQHLLTQSEGLTNLKTVELITHLAPLSSNTIIRIIFSSIFVVSNRAHIRHCVNLLKKWRPTI